MKRIKVLEWKKVSLVVPEKQDIKLWYEGMNNLEIWKNLVYTFWKVWHLEDEEEFYEIQRKRVDSQMFCIYENWKIIDDGNFKYLLEKNKNFSRMWEEFKEDKN